MQKTATSLSVFLLAFFSFSLLWKLENNVLISFFSPVLSSDLVISLSVHLSVLSFLNNFLSSLFLFNCYFLLFLFLSVSFCAVYFVFPSIFFYSSFCSLFCRLLLFSFTYFPISHVFFVCFLNTSSFLFSFPITLFFLLVTFALFLLNLFSF